MDDIHLMTVFVAAAEGSGFAAAGRRLDLSPAAVTRAIQALEARCGVALFVRDGRRLRLSAAGDRHLEDARAVLRLLAAAEAEVASENVVARGCLRVTAPAIFGRLFVVPALSDYLVRYPDMTASAVFVDRTVNLIDEGFDLAVRIGRLPDSGMKAVKVGEVERAVVASAAYLARHGTPADPLDLPRHRVVATDASAPHATWRFGRGASQVAVKLKPVLGVTTNDAAIAAAVAGVGLVQVPAYQVSRQVADGSLVRVLADHAGDALPIHLLHRESRFGSSKVRHFIDLLAARLRAA